MTWSFIKPSFNKGKWKPQLPEKQAQRVGLASSAAPPKTVSKSLVARPTAPKPSHFVRRQEPESLSGAERRHVIHEQRKHAANILRNLVKKNTKQINLPVVKILKALQKVDVFKVRQII